MRLPTFSGARINLGFKLWLSLGYFFFLCITATCKLRSPGITGEDERGQLEHTKRLSLKGFLVMDSGQKNNMGRLNNLLLRFLESQNVG